MSSLPKIRLLEPLALARPLALVLSVGLVGLAAAFWGRPAAAAAAVGSLLSFINIWVLGRLASRAARQALSQGPEFAGTGLHAALGAKTIVLLFTVALVAGVGGAGLPMLPFGLGLLVTSFALLLAGLTAAAAAR
jgi:hypothetical protein